MHIRPYKHTSMHIRKYTLELEILTLTSLSVFKSDYKNYLTFINHCSHVRGNSNCYGVLPAEDPVYNWRTVIVSTCTRIYHPWFRQSFGSHQPSNSCTLDDTQLKDSTDWENAYSWPPVAWVWQSVVSDAVKRETALYRSSSLSCRLVWLTSIKRRCVIRVLTSLLLLSPSQNCRKVMIVP